MTMTIIDDIIENEIRPLLEAITIDGTNLTVLNGFLVTYVKDLLSGKDGLSFPCVALQPIDDIPTLNGDNTKFKIARSMRLVGAVITKDASLITGRLNTLVREIRWALILDKYDNKSKAMDYVIGATTYDIPDSNDHYATFEMTITFNYVEEEPT